MGNTLTTPSFLTQAFDIPKGGSFGAPASPHVYNVGPQFRKQCRLVRLEGCEGLMVVAGPEQLERGLKGVQGARAGGLAAVHEEEQGFECGPPLDEQGWCQVGGLVGWCLCVCPLPSVQCAWGSWMSWMWRASRHDVAASAGYCCHYCCCCCC